jgi:uncharacterized metal-binding protein
MSTDEKAASKSTPKDKASSCLDCHSTNCYRGKGLFPDFCLTRGLSEAEVRRVTRICAGKGPDGRMARAAAEIEGRYYGKLTRVEEVLAFAKRIDAKRLGLATCVGLIEEARIFAVAAKAKGFSPYGVLCKLGSIDKSAIGVPDEQKVEPGCHESMCNPIGQAWELNAQKTDLNIIIGLCVGHDSLFIKHSHAPVTTLIVKDRVLGHNPAAALYTSSTYYKRLFKNEEI